MEEQKEKKEEGIGPPDRRFRRELILSLVQYASWPAATLLGVVLLLFWLWISGAELELLKGAGFEARFNKSVAEQGLSKEVGVLRQLDYDQLQLFLIVGRDRREQRISYSGPEANTANWEALQRAELLTFKKINENTVDFQVTAKANRLHSAIMENLAKSIKK
jgi:hypothetical protein